MELLESLDIDFQLQKPVGRYRVDFFIEPDKIIEADGDFWHSRPDQIAYGKERDSILHSLGYKILHISGTQLQNRETALAMIKEFFS